MTPSNDYLGKLSVGKFKLGKFNGGNDESDDPVLVKLPLKMIQFMQTCFS